MDEQLRKIDGIIIRHLLKETSGEEEKLLLTWLKKDPANQDYFFTTREVWEASHPGNPGNFRTDDSWKALKVSMEAGEKRNTAGKRNQLWLNLLKYAAIVVLVSGLALAGLIIGRNILNNEMPVTYTEVMTPNGQKKEITLPDGTQVWLNSGTTFKYASDYGKANREVFLQGEAYFQVTRDITSTFIVRADKITIRVLGTSFNVNCYPELQTIETTVITGMVSLENNGSEEGKDVVILNKLEKATFNKDHDKIYISKDNGKNDLNSDADPIALKKLTLSEEETSYIASWKDQSLSFNNETFEEMAIKLERWFNVKIILKDENLKKYRYKGKFDNVRSIFQVLEVVKLATPITYEYNEKNKEITIKEIEN
jgi:transmembrane sensor